MGGDGMSDLVKRLRYEADGAEFSNRYADLVGEAADRIEQLERELAESHKAHEHTSFMLGRKLSDLAAERALADRCAAEIKTMSPELYRDYHKARGL